MEQPDGHQASSNPTTEREEVVVSPVRHRWKDFSEAGTDRHIELILAFAITFFAAAQWITGCRNNASTSIQVDHIITAANRINDAADSFSTSSANINKGVSNAVDKLNLQAEETKQLTQQALEEAKASKIGAATAVATLQEIKNTDRAFLFVRGVDVVSDKISSGNQAALAFIVNLENSGSTQPKHLYVSTNCGTTAAFGNPLDFRRLQKPAQTMVGPKSITKIYSCSATREYAFSASYFVFGKATYEDVFGKKHVTEYCWVLYQAPSVTSPTMAQCWGNTEDAKHNCADDDCPAM